MQSFINIIWCLPKITSHCLYLFRGQYYVGWFMFYSLHAWWNQNVLHGNTWKEDKTRSFE